MVEAAAVEPVSRGFDSAPASAMTSRSRCFRQEILEVHPQPPDVASDAEPMLPGGIMDRLEEYLAGVGPPIDLPRHVCASVDSGRMFPMF